MAYWIPYGSGFGESVTKMEAQSMNGHATVTIGHLSEARKFWGHGLSHAQDLPCELCTKLAQLLADFARDERLKEAEWWRWELPLVHANDCSHESASGPEGDFCDCGLNERKKRVEEHIEQLKRGEL